MEDPSALEEERRLCYVGVTRAKERLYLMRAFRRRVGYRGGSEPSMASRYLADIPSELILTEREPPARARATKWASTAPRIEPAMAGVVTRRRASEPAVPEAATAGFSVGDKVRHAKFGDGIVMSCEPSGTDFEATVAFKEGFGVKRLLLSFAALEKVE